MAILQNNKDDDKDINKQTITAPGATAAPAGTSQPAPNQQKSSSGRFTNISNFIRANQGGQQLAQNIGSNIQQKGQAIKQDVATAGQQFAEQSDQGRLNKAQVLPEAQNIVQRAGKGLEGDVERFKRLSSGLYQGPAGLQNAGILQNRAAEVEGLGRNLMSSAGRQATLGQMYGGSGGYTAGQRRLDDLLIGGSQDLKRARGMAAGLGRSADQESKRATNLANFFTEEASQVGQESNRILGDSRTAEDKALDERYKSVGEEEANMRALIDRTLSDVKSGRISREAFDKLNLGSVASNAVSGIDSAMTNAARLAGAQDIRADGSIGYGGEVDQMFSNAKLSPENLNKLYTFGVDPTKYIKGVDAQGDFTREAVASKDQSARINALAKLAGFNDPLLNEQLAESYKVSQLTADPEFEKAVLEGRKGFEDTLNQAELARRAVVQAREGRDAIQKRLEEQTYREGSNTGGLDLRKSNQLKELERQYAASDYAKQADELARLTGNIGQLGNYGALDKFLSNLGIY